MINKTQQIKIPKRVGNFDYYIFNHENNKFLSNKEIVELIVSYGNFKQECWNQSDNDEGDEHVEIDWNKAVELWEGCFLDFDYRNNSHYFDELEMISKPMFIFGEVLNEDKSSLDRIKWLKRLELTKGKELMENYNAAN